MRRYLEDVDVRTRAVPGVGPSNEEALPGGPAPDGAVRLARTTVLAPDGEASPGEAGGGEPAVVPEMFIWGDRLYVVRRVVATWAEARPWWRSDARPRSRRGRRRRAAAAQPMLELSAEAGPGGETVPLGSPVVTADAEVQSWRVEAARGRHADTVVVDLSYDPSSQRWHLVRVMD